MNSYDGGECKSCPEDEDRLRELLDDVAPDESDGAEQDHDDAGEILGTGLTVKVLK